MQRTLGGSAYRTPGKGPLTIAQAPAGPSAVPWGGADAGVVPFARAVGCLHSEDDSDWWLQQWSVLSR